MLTSCASPAWNAPAGMPHASAAIARARTGVSLRSRLLILELNRNGAPPHNGEFSASAQFRRCATPIGETRLDAPTRTGGSGAALARGLDASRLPAPGIGPAGRQVSA